MKAICFIESRASRIFPSSSHPGASSSSAPRSSYHSGSSCGGFRNRALTPSREGARKARTITCRSASTTSSRQRQQGRDGPGSRADDLRQLLSRLEELRQLTQEAAEVTIATGPRAIARTAQAIEAFLAVSQDQLGRLRTRSVTDPPPVVLRQLFERLGATYIKLGQFIASSPTLFPADYVEEFQKCLDQAPPVPFDVVRKTIETDLGMSLEDIFESVQTEPLASASIAQVHAAVLRGSKKDVVIKVLKPGVEDTLVRL